MYPRESNLHIYEAATSRGHGGSSHSANTAQEAAYLGAYEELFGPDAGIKAGILAHPLFEQLLAAHVACLRVATPEEEQHVIDAALGKQHNVVAKYLALLSHLQSLSHPAENQDLSNFMAEYILLLQSFKEKLLDHLHREASEAISSFQEIEQALFNLTGVFASSSHKGVSIMTKEDKKKCDGKYNDGLGRLGLSSFLPCDIQKEIRDHVRKELKQELKEDYHTKLKEVHDEILRKRRAGRLPDDTTELLKDWWTSHAKWPYPTEDDKAQLVEETGLDLKQINNWFINQRKRNWLLERNNADDRTS